MNYKIGNSIKAFSLLMLLLIGTTMCSQKDVDLFSEQELAIRLSDDPDLIKAVQIQHEINRLILNQEIIMPTMNTVDRMSGDIRSMESTEQMKEYLKNQDFKGAEQYAELHMKNVEHMAKAMERFPEFGQMRIEDSSEIIQEALRLAKAKVDMQRIPPDN